MALAAAAGLFLESGVFAQGDVTRETDYRKVKDPGLYGTVIMKRNIPEGSVAKPVLFPHWAHRSKYTCNVCHTEAGFAMKAGDTDIKQADIESGKYCGSCHNSEIAFGVDNCVRCHSYGLIVPDNSKMEDKLSGYPADDFGNKVDWVRAMRTGSIEPAASLDGKGKLKTLDSEVIIPANKMSPHPPDVLFPHKAHTEQMDCATCHPSIFQQKKGGNPEMNMMKIMYGQYCGTCHGAVAFPLENCFRCHSQPVPVPVEDDEKKDEKDKKDKSKE